MKSRVLLSATLLAFSLSANAATEVIALNYRMAADVLPIVQSVLGSEGRVSPYGNQLIVNAPAAKIEEVRALLQQLDTQPKRLLISVDSSEASYRSDRGYGVDGSISAGSGRVEIGRGETDGRDQARIIRRSTDSRGGGTQQVQASEGSPALIQVGQSVPITSSSRGPYGQVYNNTEYRDVTRGFYVTASLSGDIVHIDISSNRDRLSQTQPGVIDIQGADTRVSGRVGEWISIGGSVEESQADQRGIARRYSTQGRDDMTLRVKVDVID
ncbi:secretin N-terminal domain-containing protein [Phytopseudomonas dryadis]|uniref:Secretin n=1 Tax=Phytopseudomonas dryadis TaxID=2487520 RepID=A0A4Q9RBQ9_9GAMM|nr:MULTISPECIES: secretin N-terminal domain-containing protein [Pseudomonas]TBU97449.1 secretin [Pseudomonas dryadis]TBV09921.1 secretin [Pseudomonas dryadis]TBV15564.1 secretin [Pseudomonas sp. FRB 230]